MQTVGSAAIAERAQSRHVRVPYERDALVS
jgi:hypothetical protein